MRCEAQTFVGLSGEDVAMDSLSTEANSGTRHHLFGQPPRTAVAASCAESVRQLL